MSDCSRQFRLGAYYDGELDPSARREFESHAADCKACALRLQELRLLSTTLAKVGPAPISQIELARIHRAIDQCEDRGLLRLASGMAAAAASILIISSAWLYDAPRRGRIGPASTTATEQPWEALARGSGAAPILAGQPRWADETARWMIDSVAIRDHHEYP